MPSLVVARLHPLTGGDEGKVHRNKYGQGISPVYDRTGQVSEIRFSELSSPEDVRRWLDSHRYTGYELSTPQSEDQPAEQHRHYLALEFVPEGSNLVEMDGGLLVKGVKLLAAGTWTDSVQKTPCRYTPLKLKTYSTNWADPTYWSRHGGGTPRNATDVIGEVRNPRFEGDAVVGDLWYDGITDNSQNCIRIVKAAAAGKRKAPYVSVEMMTRDKWLPAEKIYEAEEILFDGLAMVNRGACAVCTINARAQEEAAPASAAAKEENVNKEQQAPDGSLEAQREDLQTALNDKFGIAESDGRKWGAWITATYPDRVVFQSSKDDVLYEVPYSVSPSREILFGTPYEVEIIYRKVQPDNPTPENTMESKDYEAKINDLTKELEGLKAENASLKTPPQAAAPAEPDSKALEEATAQMKALEARVKELENKPNPKIPGATATPADGETKELEAPATRVVVSRTGEVHGA